MQPLIYENGYGICIYIQKHRPTPTIGPQTGLQEELKGGNTILLLKRYLFYFVLWVIVFLSDFSYTVDCNKWVWERKRCFSLWGLC